MSDIKPFMAACIRRPEHSTGPAVLLLHGFYSSGERDWPSERWADAIVAQGRPVVVADLPAHGGSDRVEGSETATTSKVVDAIADLVRPLGVPVDIVGYSLGARLAWTLAARYPELVHSAVFGGLAGGDPFAALDYAAARTFADGGPAPADQMTAMIAGMAVGPDKDSHSLLDLMQGLGSEPFDPAVEAPASPVLLVAGTEDHIAGGIEALEPHLTDSRTQRVPGDHFGALHDPAFRAVVFNFIGLTL